MRTSRATARTAIAVGLAVALTLAASPTAPARAAAVGPSGYASAASYALRVAPSIGGTALTVTFGGAGSYVQNKLANGIAAAADLGLFQTLFQTGVCGFPGFDTSFIPAATLITNEKGDRAQHDEIAGEGGAAIGTQDVRVTRQPLADAAVGFARLLLGDGLRLGGLTARAETKNLDGATPLGIATAHTDLEIPGILSLRGLQWDVRQQGGAKPTGKGTFVFAGGEVLGVAIPPSDGVAAATVINTLLAEAGLTVTLPKVVKEVSGSTSITRVTPLALSFAASDTMKTGLAPVLEQLRTAKEQIVKAVGSTCFSSYGALMADLALGFVVGSGRLTLLIGGAEAKSNDDEFVDPFGAAPGETVLPDILENLPGAESSVLTGDVMVPDLVEQAARASAVERVCESVHPNRSPDCSDGRGVVAGIAVFVAAALAAGFDVAKRRRRARLAA